MTTASATPLALVPPTDTPRRVLMDLSVNDVRPSATNPRRSFDEAALAELQASIAEVGIQEPLLVRPIYGDSDVDFYEVVSGHRRLRVADNLMYKRVPCIVVEMSADQAAEASIVANLQRVDIHPVEEAEAFQSLLEVLGSIAAVAARLGKEQSYVAKVLRLNALTLPSRDAMRGGLITIEHALLLARLAETEQNAALKWTLDRNAGSTVKVGAVLADCLARVKQQQDDRAENPGASSRYFRPSWEAATVTRLKAWIEAESGILLSRAPWSLTDEDYLVPDMGPCSECERNTKANAPLFGDLEMGEPTCTDGACFAAKTVGFVQIAMRKAGHDEIAKPKVLVPRLSWKYSSVAPSIVPNNMGVKGATDSCANPAKLLKKGQWVEAKAGSCPNVRPGITADWSDDADRGYMGSGNKVRQPGELILVCIAKGCKVHPKDWEMPAKPTGNDSERSDPAEEKRREENRAHLMKTETAIRSSILYAVLAKLDATRALKLVVDDDDDAPEWRERILAVMPDIDGATLEAYTLLCSSFDGRISPNSYWMMEDLARDRKEIFQLAKSAGLDGPRLVAKYFHDQGSIAPASDKLYPKGIPWPKSGASAAVAAPAKKAVAKKTAKVVAKKAAKPVKKTLTAASRKRIVDAMAKRMADRKKAGVKA